MEQDVVKNEGVILVSFDPGIKIGSKLTNDEMRTIFKCGNMGGMRRSKSTGTLVIISDETKGLYLDRWEDGVLHYTGMGKIGDQVLEGNQNRTLYESNSNGIEVHLFEVLKRAEYTYRGVVKLAASPYISRQKDDNQNLRNVWIFPVKPISDVDEMIEKIDDDDVKKLSDADLKRNYDKIDSKRTAKVCSTKVFLRNPYLKELVKRIAEGKCQFCGEDAPFADLKGEPYLEEHHVEPLADGGLDRINNVVAICPNCHRKMHIRKDDADISFLKTVAQKNEQMLKRMAFYVGANDIANLNKK